jgi:hypothetical protein
VSRGKEDEGTGRTTTTAALEMGGRAGRGEGGPAAAADLPIQLMGGHASQAGGIPGARVAKDGGQRPRSAGRGEEDERGEVRRGR